MQMSLGRSDASPDTGYEVDLIPMSDGRMRLDFLLKFSIAEVVWKPEYQFVLQPIEVTETQMLTAKLQDANDSLEQLHSIIPAWVMKDGDRSVPRNEAALQLVALRGTQSWLYMCGLAKHVLGNSGAQMASAKEWSAAAVRTSRKYWWLLWEAATEVVGSAVRQLMLTQ
ncbi:unnamed protein product [Phytophthora lilii]|uniref:Unnamed protein product n=1 Tax=Phytophthora lilii TaxID=2077276 RepID=A0A9W6UBK6_9STRA|nr:unnamed protein product [Phytophthora lilii]